MAAQSGKLFQEILCESRAHPVDTTNPVAAKVIDDLKKQVSQQRHEIEAERTKLRELQRNHERELRTIREQAEKKLDRSLDALSRRKDDEKLAELAQVKERLLKQNQQELRMQRTDLEEEMARLERRLAREREESVRKVLDIERKKTEEELSHYLPEDSVMSREEHLKAEIFRLGEEVERLEFQVSNLQRENREQINVIKKATHDHKMEVESLKKKNQAEAARDLAQLKLAEQIIQEKERIIQDEEYRVDMAIMEKEALAEELVNVKSRKTLDTLNRDEAVMSPTTGKRVVIPGGGGVLQRRVEELEGALRKLDEERRQLKQENALLRKTAVKEGGGGEGDGKGAEEKLKRLRKRNAELAALAGQLNEKIRSLKMENEQLQKQSGSVTSSLTSVGGGGGERGKGGGSGGGGDGDVRRSLSRQHAKDISEYTKQILTKDREIESVRKRLAKYEVGGVARYEPAPEMEKRVRSMAMERLRIEKVMVQLYSKVSDPLDVGVVTKREMEREAGELERLFDENESLREQLELLKSQARMEDVDLPPQSPLVKQHSLPAHVAAGQAGGTAVATGGKGVSDRERQLVGENSQLQARVTALVKCEAEVDRLEATLKELESTKSSYETQNKRLTQQLKDAQQLAQEMDAVQEMCVELEKEVAEVKGQLSERDLRILQLEKSYHTASESLTDTRQEADSLRAKVDELEEALREKQAEIRRLASELDQQQRVPQSSPPLHPMCDVSLQTNLSPSPQIQKLGNITLSAAIPPSHPPPPASSCDRSVKDRPSSAGERRVKSAGKSRRLKSPVKRSSGAGEADESLDNEMRLAGYELTDPYDSSEAPGFSDTNLDGSSILSMEEVAEGARGDLEAEGVGVIKRPPFEATSDLHRLGWVGQEGEGFLDGLSPSLAQSHDISRESQDTSRGSHDTSRESHDTARDSHDITRESHDSTDDTTGQSHDIQMVDLECVEGLEEEVSTTSDTQNKGGDNPSQDSAPPTSEPTASPVAVFIAKYSYNPAEMSPNSNYDQELSIAAGDYLYVFGDMDADGFYLTQLVTGESGLVPSNFVEKVADGEGESSLPHPSRLRARSRRTSDLQDIPELDEDVSTSSSTPPTNNKIPPPCDLELERQFVENDKYSVVIQWSAPPSLSQAASSSSSLASQQVTYHTYVNHLFKEAVAGSATGITTAHLADIPRHQLVKISVRTVTEEGESPDPKKLIILNPQYPEPPTKVRVSLLEEPPSSRALLVEWAPSRPPEMGEPISGYVILVNNNPLMKLQQSNDISRETVCVKITASHLESLSSLLSAKRIVLSVRAVSDRYQSLDSVPVVIARELVDKVMVGSNRSSDPREASSLPDRGNTNTATEHHVTQAGGYVTQSNSHMTTNGVRHPQINGSVEFTDRVEEVDGERAPLRGEPRYYVALYSYNPVYHSPNEDIAEEELAFREDDVIIACSETDEEGFFEGMLRGKRGLVPSNMVELITDQERLEQITQLLAEQQSRSPDPLTRLPTINGGDAMSDDSKKMRALYGYNPAADSPNENKEDELCIEEGDIITVFGRPDEVGYYKGELKGKHGLVPSNFLEPYEGERVEKGRTGSMGMEIFAASEEDMEQAKRIIAEASDSLKRSSSLSSSTDSTKHKKGLFSMGKSLLSKGVGKK